jgi:DNA-binding winged helix-turn-helix (wHTH) protein
MRLRFGGCVFDSEARELWRDARPLALSPQAFHLLSLLLEARPRPLPQRELRDALWPDTHVGYTSLSRVVTEVRKALGDTARPARLVRTVTRFGYAFVGPVTTEIGPRDGAAICVLVCWDREFLLPRGETLVGRGPECGAALRSDQVSRVHARVRIDDQRATIEDLGSKNGTRVNGTRLQEPAILRDGDEILFGSFRAVFRSGGTQGSTRSGTPR